MEIAAEQRAPRVVLSDGAYAVVQEARGDAAAHRLIQTPHRIVAERGAAQSQGTRPTQGNGYSDKGTATASWRGRSHGLARRGNSRLKKSSASGSPTDVESPPSLHRKPNPS